MSAVDDARAQCDHRESTDPRRAGKGNCEKCGLGIPPWFLTEAYARQVYEGIGMADLAEHAIGRLRMGGRDYAWTAYLHRENAPEGIDELIDAIHYTIFETLRTYKLEAEGAISAEDAEVARQALAEAALLAAQMIRQFQIAAAALKR